MVGKGGFFRPIRLGTWLRDRLSDGRTTHAFVTWGIYKLQCQRIPLARGKGKRQVISYQGFRSYLYMLRRLGLIEYVRTPEGEIISEVAKSATGLKELPYLAPRLYFTAVLGKIGDPAWEDPFGYLYPHLAGQRHR